MKIIESWEDHNHNCYAIVRHSKSDQEKYGGKRYEAMWLDDETSVTPELFSFGGSVGYNVADFNTMAEAKDFLLKGICEYDVNPEVWLDMVAV
jgi:hypothetical protein